MINLCFHGIGVCVREREPGEARYWVSRDLFCRVLDRIDGRVDIGISFDDGNISDIEIGLPELRERGLTATFFALAGRLEDPRSLSADALRELRGNGMEIGSHGWAHVPWRSLDASQTEREFSRARRALAEASGGAVDQAALPLGRYDRTTLRGLRASGFRHVYTSDRYPARANAWLQPRYSITADDSAGSVARLTDRRLSTAGIRGRAVAQLKRWR